MTLLKAAEQIIFKEDILEKLRSESSKLIRLWSSDILEIWIEVYALALAELTKLRKKQGSFDEYKQETQQECKQLVQKMIDRNQSNKIRIKGATLIGLLAKYSSIGDPEAYNTSLIPKL